jgi:hypothetical protein
MKKKSAKKKQSRPARLSRKGPTVRKKGRSVAAKNKPKRTTQRRAPRTRLDDAKVSYHSPDLPSPDDQGLSRRASADSESVDELLDEGNAFEAGVISGVERADDSSGKEVRTQEVPEDDVPGEYLDNDS